MIKLWQRIDCIRKQKGVKLKDIAVICGVTPPAVQKWKNGGQINLECLNAIANFLGTSLSVLLEAPPTMVKIGVNVPLHDPNALAAHESLPPTDGEVQSSNKLCRFPADCDLIKELAEHRATMNQMKAQLDTLTQLLGASLRTAVEAPERDKRKAG